jgi:zinc protease
MNRLLTAALALIAPLGLALPANAVTIQTVTGGDGVTAWLVEDHSVKNVAIRLAFKGGSALDPKGKEGLAELVSGLLDEGAGDLDSAAFHAKLEEVTASFDADSGLSEFSLSSRVKTDRLDDTVALLHLSLTAPRFDAEAVERIKGDVIAEIAEQNERPEHIADRVWHRVAFGAHPYARSSLGTPDSIGRIEIADLKQFVHDRFTRDHLLIGIVGDIGPDGAKLLLDKMLAGLPAQGTPDTVPDITVDTGNEILLSHMNVPQSVAIFGGPGLKRDDSDWYAGALVMHILGGGGFDSRLTEEVRVKRGLAYSVEESPDPMQHSALILGEVATRNAKIGEAVQVIRDEVRRMRDGGPTDAELAAAKTYLTGSFALAFDSTQRIASLLVTIQRDQLGIDYLNRRNTLFESVTLDQAKAVAKRILDPDKLLFSVVGDPESMPGAKPAPEVE